MNRIIHSYPVRRCLVWLGLVLVVAGCAVAEQAPPTITPDLSVPLGFPRHPVTNNAVWTPQMKTFEGVDMMFVPVGCFIMGSDFGDADERPIYPQCFQQPYWIDRFEVTNEQFDRIGGLAQLASVWSDSNRPRTNVRWFEARDFCVLRDSRLPTEAEWEYAARGPDSLNYPWGNAFVMDYGIYMENSDRQTAEVGSRPMGISWVGDLDMTGNVWEWTSTIYEENRYRYPYTSDDGRENPGDTTALRVMRGGSWYDGSEYYSRAANRGRLGPTIQDFNIGFRCVRDYSST